MAVCLTSCEAVFNWFRPVPFTMQVFPTAITDSVAGERCVLLVTVQDEELASGFFQFVHVSASAPGAVVTVEHDLIQLGEVAEITVLLAPQTSSDGEPEGGDSEGTVEVAIRACRGPLARTATLPITLLGGDAGSVGETAARMRDSFIPYLAEEHPELGITAETEWVGTIVTPHILIVSHYLFFSDEWEMHVSWHVMVPPYDWARIELRRRFVETAPSMAFEIPSLSAGPPYDVQTVEPSDSIWR